MEITASGGTGSDSVSGGMKADKGRVREVFVNTADESSFRKS